MSSRAGGIAVVALLLSVGVAGYLVRPATAQPAQTVRVAFLQGEQLARVKRPGTTPRDAIRALLAGPTVAERKQGFRTYLPEGTKLRGLHVSPSVATVNFGKPFAGGRPGPATSDAVLAFQKWEGLDRTGIAGVKTKKRLQTAVRPAPVSVGSSGKRAEVLIDRQVTLLIRNNKVVRAISVSSGKASTPTPPGNYRVYAKIKRWWSTPFREWLPWAIPFVGGIDFHEFAVVPTYPASHGCVRQVYTVAQWTYGFAQVGMPVKVIAAS